MWDREKNYKKIDQIQCNSRCKSYVLLALQEVDCICPSVLIHEDIALLDLYGAEAKDVRCVVNLIQIRFRTYVESKAINKVWNGIFALQ